MAGGNVAGWGALSVRAVVFSEDLTAPANDLFVTAFAQQASNYSSPPPNLFGAPSVASAFDKAGQNIVLQRSLGRIDLFYNPGHATNSRARAAELIDLHASLTAIQSAASQVAALAAQISRVALIVDLGKSTDTVTEANRIIREVLPFDTPIEEELDFVLQFTRRYELNDIDNAKININYRWAVSSLQQFTVAALPLTNFTSTTERSNFFLAQVTLDLNSVPESNVNPRRVKEIYKDIADKVDQIRRSGPI